MWFLAAQPLLYTLCAYYGGLLAKIKRTIPILLARFFSLLIITIILLATVNMDPFSGVYVVACSSCIGSLVTLFWLRYSWKKMIPKLQEDLTFIKI
jgi:Na+-driven multidrug efflux pump